MTTPTESRPSNPLGRLLRRLLWHESERYFVLPRTYSLEAHPEGEGPFGRVPRSWGDRLYDITGGTHPTPAFYVVVAVILGFITLVEYLVFNWTIQRVWINALLYALSTIKFVMVIGFFMHLKFDAPVFRALFGFGLLLAVAIALSLLALFFKLNG